MTFSFLSSIRLWLLLIEAVLTIIYDLCLGLKLRLMCALVSADWRNKHQQLKLFWFLNHYSLIPNLLPPVFLSVSLLPNGEEGPTYFLLIQLEQWTASWNLLLFPRTVQIGLHYRFCQMTGKKMNFKHDTSWRNSRAQIEREL